MIANSAANTDRSAMRSRSEYGPSSPMPALVADHSGVAHAISCSTFTRDCLCSSSPWRSCFAPRVSVKDCQSSHKSGTSDFWEPRDRGSHFIAWTVSRFFAPARRAFGRRWSELVSKTRSRSRLRRTQITQAWEVARVHRPFVRWNAIDERSTPGL